MPKIKVKGQTVQTGERPQTNGQTHERYHSNAVDNKQYKYSVQYMSKTTRLQRVVAMATNFGQNLLTNTVVPKWIEISQYC